jgi:transcription antitermination factor NusG
LIRTKFNKKQEFIECAKKAINKFKLDDYLVEFKCFNEKKKNLKSYILCHCFLNEEMYRILKKIPNFMGFAGDNLEKRNELPKHLSTKNLRDFFELEEEEKKKEKRYKNFPLKDASVGDLVKIVGGTFDNHEGRIIKIDNKKSRYTIVLEKLG